ncbi:MAG: hypothetical protein ACPIOQ_35740, partial [Promethearchaeia archaeon]
AYTFMCTSMRVLCIAQALHHAGAMPPAYVYAYVNLRVCVCACVRADMRACMTLLSICVYMYASL